LGEAVRDPFLFVIVVPVIFIGALLAGSMVKNSFVSCQETYTETTIAASVECKNGAKLEVRERAILCVCPKDGAK
jgi:hypothetical protein